MPVFTEGSSISSTIAEQMMVRRPRSQFSQTHQQDQNFSTETDPNPHISRTSKSSTISSLFLSHFSTNTPAADPSTNIPTTKKKSSATFRGLGCTAGAAEQVSVPAVIRSSAEWEGKKVKKKKNPQQKRKKKSSINIICSETGSGVVEGGSQSNSNNIIEDTNNGSCMVIQDVWCGPGIGFSSDAVVGSVDCVVAARRNLPGRGKIDGEKFIQRERERERERDREREVFPIFIFFFYPAFVSFLIEISIV